MRVVMERGGLFYDIRAYNEMNYSMGYDLTHLIGLIIGLIFQRLFFRSMENETTVPYARRLYIAAFSILAVLVFIAGFFYYQNRTTSIKRDKFNELSAIAQLKQNQIKTWMGNTIINGVIFSQNEMFIS